MEQAVSVLPVQQQLWPHVVWESGGSLGRYGVAAYRSRVMRNVPFHSLSNVMWLKSNQALRRSLDGHHLAEVKQLVCLQSCFQICFLFLFVWCEWYLNFLFVAICSLADWYVPTDGAIVPCMTKDTVLGYVSACAPGCSCRLIFLYTKESVKYPITRQIKKKVWSNASLFFFMSTVQKAFDFFLVQCFIEIL